jgi:hypothetical protein
MGPAPDPTSVPEPHLPEPDRLDRLVTLLDAVVSEGGWHQPHRIVSVETAADDDDVALGFQELEAGVHPLDHLLGFVAPPTWSAIGVVCFGWAAPAVDLDPDRHTAAGRPSLHPERCRVRVVSLVDRSGTTWATAALEDGTVVDEPGEGTVADALRRCLRLPTAPPPVGTAELFAALWLADVAAAGRPLSWTEAALRHPALRLLARDGHRPQPEDVGAAAVACRDRSTRCRRRARPVDGGLDGRRHVRPMDAGDAPAAAAPARRVRRRAHAPGAPPDAARAARVEPRPSRRRAR